MSKTRYVTIRLTEQQACATCVALRYASETKDARRYIYDGNARIAASATQALYKVSREMDWAGLDKFEHIPPKS